MKIRLRGQVHWNEKDHKAFCGIAYSEMLMHHYNQITTKISII